MSVLDLMDVDGTTVLFSFHDPTGAVNPSGLRTKLGAGLDVGSVEPELKIARAPGRRAQVTARDAAPIVMRVPLNATATSYANLRDGLGQLAAWLDDPTGPLRWTVAGVVRYIDLLGALNLPELARGATEHGLIGTRFSTMGPIQLELLRQYGMRGTTVTTSGVTVPMDPATSTKVRVYPVTITGDLPTPARIDVTMDASSAVVRARIGHRAQGRMGSSAFTDYLSDTGFAQLEASGRGWTVTAGLDAAGAVDSAASPGSGTSTMRVTYATNPTVLARRVTVARTTKIASLVGTWDVILRAKGTSTAANQHDVQLRWGVTALDPLPNTNPIVPVTLANPASTAEYGEYDLGRITIPAGATYANLKLEVWGRRVSGTGNLDLDYLWLVPAEDQGTAVLPASAPDSTAPADFTSPPDTITGDPAFAADDGVVGGRRSLIANLDSCGAGPNTGIVWGTGQHEVTFPWSAVGTMTVKFRVTNVTDDAEAAATTLTNPSGNGQVVLTFAGVAGKAYQAMVGITSYTSGFMELDAITRRTFATVVSGEALRTDPGERYTIDRLDSGDAFMQEVSAEGAVPALLEPGPNHLMIQTLDAPASGYATPRSRLAETPTVVVIYDPRYAL